MPPVAVAETSDRASSERALEAALDEVSAWLSRRVGYAEASVMAYDPDVLLPVAFTTSEPCDLAHAQAACRNEQLDADIHKFRDLALRPAPVASMSLDVPEARTSIRWMELIEPSGHRHELRAALVDGRGRCWGRSVSSGTAQLGFLRRM